MIKILELILSPVLKFAFGSAARIKITITIIAVIAVGGGVWYVTDQYSNMKVKVAELEVQLKDCRGTAKELRQHLIGKEQEIIDKQSRFDEVIENRRKLESEFKQLERRKESDLEVFNKECGRFERLMQKKASLIVKLANRAAERLRDRAEAATRTDDNH